MPFPDKTYKFMFSALQEAGEALEQNEVPVGAVVVYKNRIIGRGYNQVEKLKDPTAHAEMIAITAAAGYLGDWRLNECDIFVSLEPCIMCAGALLASRIKNLYFSTFDPKYGACGSLYNVAAEGKYNHKVNVYSGLLAEESMHLLKMFFEKARQSEKN
jgi:tRNA(adenine34) deaminase